MTKALGNLPRNGSEQDSSPKAQRREALSWLRSNKTTSAFAGNHFGATSNAIETVLKLYALGAVRVEVEVKDDEKYSETMIIHGSEQSERILFAYIGSMQPDEMQYERGSFFWRLWWD